MPNGLTMWMRSFASRAKRSATMTTGDALTELRHARSALLNCVHDCPDDNVSRLQYKILHARTHQELWSLRSEVYHCVAMQHHQATASERVHSLAHHFKGWVDPADTRQRLR